MADQQPDTAPNNADQPAGDQPAATGNDGDGAANQQDVQVPEGYELIKTEDKNKLVSDRDKNFNNNQESQQKLEELEQTVNRDKFVTKFLKENKDDYPNVEPEDLEEAQDEDDVEAIAKKVQSQYERIQQRALDDLQNVPTPPPLTPEEKEKKENELRDRAQKGEDVFEEWAESTERV